jgi:flagellar capping protein FliD
MELDDFINKLKMIKKFPVIKGSGLDEVIELTFKVFKNFHSTLKANTLTIGKLQKELASNQKTIATLKKRLEALEEEVYYNP